MNLLLYVLCNIPFMFDSLESRCEVLLLYFNWFRFFCGLNKKYRCNIAAFVKSFSGLLQPKCLSLYKNHWCLEVNFFCFLPSGKRRYLMKSSKVMSSYNVELMFKSLVEVGHFEAAEAVLDLCRSLGICEIPCYVGGAVSEGDKLYNELKVFSKKYNYIVLEKPFEEGVLYKLSLK